MDWIFDNLQTLLVIAIVIVAILKKLKGQGDAESDTSSDSDPDDAARTRRLQEEIRRKIMERRGLAPGAPAPAPAPAESPLPFPPAPVFDEVRPVVVEPPREQTARGAWASDDSGILERQQQLLEQLKQYQAAKRETPVAATRATRAVTTPAAERPNLWRAELHQPASLRRAIVLREILGPPVGMR